MRPGRCGCGVRTMLRRRSRARAVRTAPGMVMGGERADVMILHAAGTGIVDTVCGRGVVVGEETLAEHVKVSGEEPTWVEAPRTLVCRYGNDTTDRSIGQVLRSVFIGEQPCRLQLHVVIGKVPCCSPRP